MFAASNNTLSGPLPKFESAKKLFFVDFSRNMMNERIPEELMSLPSLQYLYLNSNKLSGIIPENFGGSSTLLDLYLQDNELEGIIPELGNMTLISKFFETLAQAFFDQYFLLTYICLNSFQTTAELLLNGNKMTGPMPTSICDNRVNRQDETDPGGKFVNLWADCGISNSMQQVECQCCNACFVGKLFGI